MHERLWYNGIMIDILKIIMLVAVLFFVYSFLQKYTGQDISLGGGFGTGRTLQVSDEEIWSNPSPLKGSVYITTRSAPTQTNPAQEYITIEAPRTNTEPINLTGWSVRSKVSNTRVYLPPATLLLKMSGANEVQPTHLAPGEYAILHSGYSPISDIASSFHTNSCIGYVSALNEFTPPLTSSCNNPRTILPATPQNITTYGAECIDFLQRARSCKSYTTEMPAHLLPACRDLIARKLTYHSCLSEALANKGYEIFNNGGWYLYLNHESEIWRNTYEAIQLLDEDGLVVDVLRY